MQLPVKYSEIDSKTRRKVREQYVKLQNGKCYWCNCSLHESPPNLIKKHKINWNLFPSNFLKYPIHLQHDHFTGMTEGAVHAYCNAVMWQYHLR